MLSDPRDMLRQVRRRQGGRAWQALAAAATMALAASALLAQTPGALSGKLTDIRSRPLDGVTVTLRNALTGAEVRTVTGKSGAYHFSGLPPGDYTLEAVSTLLGKGHAVGFYVSAGFESKVEAAVAFTREPTAPESRAGVTAVGGLSPAFTTKSILPTSLVKPSDPPMKVSARPLILPPKTSTTAPAAVARQVALEMPSGSPLAPPRPRWWLRRWRGVCPGNCRRWSAYPLRN
jgi:hypothetical protein